MSGSLPRTLMITVGAGRTRPQGRRLTVEGLDPVVALGQALDDLPGSTEAWWSGAVFRGDYRREDHWERSDLVGVDLDFRDAGGKHVAVPIEFRRRFLGWQPQLPGSLLHSTPRGYRVVFLLERTVEDVETWRGAARGAAKLIQSSLFVEDLSYDAGRRRAGLAVDEGASGDAARLWWAPRATVNGEARDAEVVLLHEDRYPVETLARLGRRATAPKARTASTKIREDGASRYGLAVLRHACEQVEGASEGGRHPTLKGRARLVAGYVAGGEVEESLARDCLLSAAMGSGLPEDEARGLIEWAFENGKKEPLAAPRWGARR